MKNLRSVRFLVLIVSFAGFAASQTAVKPGQKEFVGGTDFDPVQLRGLHGRKPGRTRTRSPPDRRSAKSRVSDKNAAYKLLLSAYANLATYTEKRPPAHRAYAEKQSQVLDKLVAGSPRDPEVLQLYAESLQDPDQKAAVLAKIVAFNPNLPTPGMNWGLITARKGKTAKEFRWWRMRSLTRAIRTV